MNEIWKVENKKTLAVEKSRGRIGIVSGSDLLQMEIVPNYNLGREPMEGKSTAKKRHLEVFRSFLIQRSFNPSDLYKHRSGDFFVPMPPTDLCLSESHLKLQNMTLSQWLLRPRHARTELALHPDIIVLLLPSVSDNSTFGYEPRMRMRRTRVRLASYNRQFSGWLFC